MKISIFPGRLGLRPKFILLVTGLLLAVFGVQSYILFTRNLDLSRASLTNEVKTYTSLSTLPVGTSYNQYYAQNHFRFGEIMYDVLRASNQTIIKLQVFNTDGDLLFDTSELYFDERENVAYKTSPARKAIAKGDLLEKIQKIDPSYEFSPQNPKELSAIIYPFLDEYNKHEYSIKYFISYKRIYENLFHESLNVLILAIITLGVASLLITIFVTRFTLKPIRQVAKGAIQIEKGDLAHTIMVNTRDEIQDLAYSVNNMAQGLLHSQEVLRQDRDTIAAERNTLSTVLGSVADGVIALDATYQILLFNHAAFIITGWKHEEVEGKRLDNVLSFFEEGVPISSNDLCNEQGDIPKRRRISFINRAGDEKTIDLVVSPVPPTYVTKLRFIISFYDVSKEKELEKLKLDFVSIATHELRTPLTAIKAYLSVFMEENKKMFNEEQNMFLQRINTSALRLGNLVENLLSVARIEKGAFTINLTAVKWPLFVAQAVEDLKNQATQAKLTLTFEKPKGAIPEIQVDTMRINEVLINLIANAMHYTPAGGSITVTTEVKDNEIVTHITDTGKGIPKEAQMRLFTKFFRVVGKLEQGSKGTGLGLYISKAIVEMHHGKIWVESEPGNGSTFSFSLPIIPQNTSAHN